jgi:hypothetical protein
MTPDTDPLIVSAVATLLICQIAVLVFRLTAFCGQQKKTFPTMIGLSGIATSVLFTTAVVSLVIFTNSGKSMVCTFAVWTCILLYTGAKAQLYVFFVERMHIVHKNPSQTRKSSPLYIFNICLLLPYAVVLSLMIVYRISYVDHNDSCRIGSGRESTLPLLIYDTIFSTYSIFVFVWPLFYSESLRSSERLRYVVKKNIIGSVVSTVSSFLNVFSVYYVEAPNADRCLMFCTLDVMVNVLVMNFLISGGGNKRISASHDMTNGTGTRAKPSFSDQAKSMSKVYPSLGDVGSSCSVVSITATSSITTKANVALESASAVECSHNEQAFCFA